MAAMKLLPMTEYGLSLVSGSYLARARVRARAYGGRRGAHRAPCDAYGCVSKGERARLAHLQASERASERVCVCAGERVCVYVCLRVRERLFLALYVSVCVCARARARACAHV